MDFIFNLRQHGTSPPRVGCRASLWDRKGRLLCLHLLGPASLLPEPRAQRAGRGCGGRRLGLGRGRASAVWRAGVVISFRVGAVRRRAQLDQLWSCWAAALVWRLPWGRPRGGPLPMPSPPLQTVEHGFPNQPSALAFDPELRIMAIGTRSGAVKMYPLRTEAFRACWDLLLAAPRAGSLGPAWPRRPQSGPGSWWRLVRPLPLRLFLTQVVVGEGSACSGHSCP